MAKKAQLIPIKMATGAKDHPSPLIGYSELTNCYADRAGPEGFVEYPIVQCDGSTLYRTLTSANVGEYRGGFVLSSTVMYVYSGTRMVKLTDSGSVSESSISGTLPSSGYVSMARNRKSTPQIGIAVASTAGNFWTLESDTLTDRSATVQALSSGKIRHCTSIDGYCLVLFDSGEFAVSAIDDMATWSALDVAEAQSSPDDGVAIGVRGRDVVVMGTNSTEFWSNTGNADFPFERTTVAQFGCLAQGTFCNASFSRPDGAVVDTIVFAATDATGAYTGICMLDGYGAKRISDFVVDADILRYSRSSFVTNGGTVVTTSDASNYRSFTYQTETGHYFYCIKGSHFTWIYDFTTGFWHKRTGAGTTVWRPSACHQFGGKQILCDGANQNLSKIVNNSTSSSASTASIYLSMSNFRTTSPSDAVTAEIASDTITIGETNTLQRFRWNRLGQSGENGFTVRVSITSAYQEINGSGTATDMGMSMVPPAVHAWPQPLRVYALHVDVAPAVSGTSPEDGTNAEQNHRRKKIITGMAMRAKVLEKA